MIVSKDQNISYSGGLGRYPQDSVRLLPASLKIASGATVRRPREKPRVNPEGQQDNIGRVNLLLA